MRVLIYKFFGHLPQKNNLGMFKTSADMSASAYGMWGGLPGLLFSLGYTAIDETIGWKPIIREANMGLTYLETVELENRQFTGQGLMSGPGM